MKKFGDDLLNNKGTFTVPANYDHDTQLDEFLRTVGCPMSDMVTDKNFAKATNKLIPGKSYRVKFFPILEKVSSENCLAFLKENKAVLVGAQGLTLLKKHKLEFFPINKKVISFDEKEALWKDASWCGWYGVPFVGGYGQVGLSYFEQPSYPGDILCCFCD